MAKLKTQTINNILAELQTNGYEDTVKAIARRSKKGLKNAAFQIQEAGEENTDIRSYIPAFVSNETKTLLKIPVIKSTVKTKSVEIRESQTVIDKKELKDARDDAQSWIDFVNDRFCPFTDYLKNFKLPVREPTKRSDLYVGSKDERTLVAACFDWHMGSQCDAEHTINKQGWSSDECDRCVDHYANEIAKMVYNDRSGINKCVILFGGDLYHTLTGETTKGTALNVELVGEVQFDRIKNAIIRYVDKMLEIFETVECHFVKGNHGGATDYGLGSTLTAWYRLEPRCKWNISKAELTQFTIYDNAIVLTHGASADSKSRFSPTRSAHNEQMGWRIFDMMSTEYGRPFKHKYIFVGDKHHARTEEYNGFELIQVGSMVKADKYANDNILVSRPSQLVCIFDERGCVSRNPVYFD